jgi:large subunit ribosomal protein L11
MSVKKKKQVQAIVKLQIVAGKATPAPPVGPALGQHGVNIMEFCKAYNEASKEKMGQIVPVEIYIYPDRTFDFKLKTPPVSALILLELNLKSGSAVPNTNKIGKLTREQLEKIAAIKMEDLNASTMDAAVNIVAGSARSMGVEVI